MRNIIITLMAREAIIANLQLPQEQRAGIGKYVGLAMQANREAQSPVVVSVKVYKEPSGTVVLGDVPHTVPFAKLDKIIDAEQAGYELTGINGITFETADALTDPDEPGVSVHTEPVLSLNIPVQLHRGR